ncbi:MAG: YkgJ family cysteine cluster protein [Candidatus Thiodiazotropha sp. (ex Myrtea sp. 'scaly one' KF741663)]|nr:YkgJ family cysteine cluster protein [Candidatus Thiodiazotropha sp. (ex Myrtea sp. 'scaly one' KF741663)]
MKKEDLKEVPCDGCPSLCCRNDCITLQPHEVNKFKSEQHYFQSNELMVAHKEDDGSCVYLTDEGCSVHHDKPAACAAFDCRLLARGVSFSRASSSPGLLAVWQKGKELLRQQKHGGSV